VGHAGDEYSCTHDHHAAVTNACRFIRAENRRGRGGDSRICAWVVFRRADLMVLGELAQSASQGAAM